MNYLIDAVIFFILHIFFSMEQILMKVVMLVACSKLSES